MAEDNQAAATIVDTGAAAVAVKEAPQAGAKDAAGKDAGQAVKAVGEAASAKGGPSATIAADDGVAEAEDKAGKDVPDWRVRMAGEDKKFLKTLERFASEKDFVDAYKSLRQKHDDKAAVKKPGKDASAEEKAAYRAAQGVPEEPKDYKLELRDNRVLGDDDKPMLDGFLKAMHEASAPPEIVSRAADWYLDQMEEVQTAQAEADDSYKAESVEKLREVWVGPDFRRNTNAIKTMFVDAPDGLFDRLFAGRLADGRRIGDDPAMMQFMAKMALDLNPAATLIPAGSDGSRPSIEGRITEIEQIMRGPDAAQKYWKDEKVQAEYRNLLAARETLQARGKAA